MGANKSEIKGIMFRFFKKPRDRKQDAYDTIVEKYGLTECLFDFEVNTLKYSH